ncbi:MAG: hypothetical protein IJ867_03865 [Clostridia bacterium]|nr:hypothetical protein [Clostridia bacterium]
MRCGNYYAQNFSVTSRLEEESYMVKDLSGFPEGSFVANLQNSAQTSFRANEQFKILIPKAGMTGDINGNFNIVGKVKNYPVFYGQAPAGYQNYTVTFDTFGDELASGNLSIPCNMGSLKVLKVDSETNSPIEGVKFELKKENSEEVYTKTTDENGEIIFDKLYQGKYVLKEVQTVQEYRMNHQSFDIDITYNQQSEITVENEIIKGWLRIIKQDLENSNVRLNGVQFELYDEEMNLLETLETDERGEAISAKYPSVNRKYYLKEIKTIDGYVLDQELKEIHLENDVIHDVFIKNAKEPKDPEIIVIEKDPPEPEIIVIEPEPEVIVIEKEPEIIIEEIEPEPIYEKVIIGEPKVIKEVVKLPKTGM